MRHPDDIHQDRYYELPATYIRTVCDWCDEPAAWLLTDTTPQGEPHAHTDHACMHHATTYAHTYQPTSHIERI